VQVLTPLVSRDYTAAHDPIRVELTALLVDDRKQPLCGSAPLHLEVIDPLGTARHDLYRGTDRGVVRLVLPLAANDPAGEWRVVVRDLLGNTEGRTGFTYRPAAQCAAVAGATRRAVLFGRDRDNIFHFFRNHKDLTLVKGTSPFDGPAAERLAEALSPWDVRCRIVNAADVKRRQPTAAEKPTWVDAGGSFDLRGPAVLLGNPDDNPLIRHLSDQKFLPYAPVNGEFPGSGRGMLAWQREALAYFGHESVTLIAFDEAGMAEAVGTAYEIASGQEQLTPLLLPDEAAVTAATRGPTRAAPAAVAWRTNLPDRVAALRAVADGAVVLSADGTLLRLRPDGSPAWRHHLLAGELSSLDVSGDGRVIAVSTGRAVRLYDPAGKQLGSLGFDPPDAATRDEGIGLMRFAPDGAHVLVALGRYHLVRDAWVFGTTLFLCDLKGDRVWTLGGVDEKTGLPLLPERALSGGFSQDGKKIILLTEQKVNDRSERKGRVLDTATGRWGRTLAGMTELLGDLPGGDVLLGDGDCKLVTFNAASEKILGELDCGKAGPIACRAVGTGFVVGTEADGTVRLVKSLAGRLIDQTVWQDRADTRIVKSVSVAGPAVAVAYWGGTLRLYDAHGKVVHEQAFRQDITASAWVGGQLAVGLADGEVVGLRAE
jgi:hypothetical protein